jgi:hypothetical protein
MIRNLEVERVSTFQD